MHPTEKIVRQFHESWDMRDPERGAEIIAPERMTEIAQKVLRQRGGVEAGRSDVQRFTGQ